MTMSLLNDLAALERKVACPTNALRDRFYSTLLHNVATRDVPFHSNGNLLAKQQPNEERHLQTAGLSVQATLAAVTLSEELPESLSRQASSQTASSRGHKPVSQLLEQLETQHALSKETVHKVLRVLLQLQGKHDMVIPNGKLYPALALGAHDCIGRDEAFKLPPLEPLLRTCSPGSASASTVEGESRVGREEIYVESGRDLFAMFKQDVERVPKKLYAWEYTSSLQLHEQSGKVCFRRTTVDDEYACAAAFREEYLLASEKGEAWYESHALLPRDNHRVLVINRQQVLRQFMYALLGISSVLLDSAGVVNERLRLQGVGYATSQELISRMCSIAMIQRRIKSYCREQDSSYSVRGMFDNEVCRLLDEHAFSLINSLSAKDRTLLEMTAHIDGSVRMLKQLEKLCADIDDASKENTSSSLDVLQVLFHCAERGQVGSRHHDATVALLKVCSRKLEAILECLLLHGENPWAHDPDGEFVRCTSKTELEDIDVSKLYESYVDSTTKDDNSRIPLELKLPKYMRSRSMSWDSNMMSWRIKTCAYSLQLLRKCSPGLYQVCAYGSPISFSLFQDASTRAFTKVAGSGFHRLREASKAIVSEMTQERERRLAAIKKERAAVRKENEDRLEKFSRAERDDAMRAQKARENHLALLKASAEEARAKKKQDRIDKIEAERAELREKHLQDEAAFNEAARWLQEKYRDVDTSHLNLQVPPQTKTKSKDTLLTTYEQEKENSVEAVAENGSVPWRHRPQIAVLRPPGGESSIQLGTWKASPPTKRLPLEHYTSSATRLVKPAEAKGTLKPRATANQKEGPEVSTDSSFDDKVDVRDAELSPSSPSKLFNLNDIMGSSFRRDQSLIGQLFNLQKVQVFTSNCSQRSMQGESYSPPISYSMETAVVSPILDHCRLIDAATVQLYLSQLSYLRVLAGVKDYLLLARGDLFHGFLKHVHESPHINWRNQALLRAAWEHERRLCRPRFSDEEEESFSFCIGVSPQASNVSHEHRLVLDFLATEFSVEWPLNALLSASVLEGFYTIHRYLLGLKETIIVYENVWLCMKKSTHAVGDILRWHEIRHFLSNYHSYVSTHVLSELWPELIGKTEKCVASPRELKQLLKDFLTSAQKTCFLDDGSTTLADCMRKLFAAVHRICNEFHESTSHERPDRSWTQFNRTRKFLMKALKSHSVSSPDASASRELLMRLNYNNYY